MNPDIERHFTTFLWKVVLSDNVTETFNDGVKETPMPEKLSLLNFIFHKFKTKGIDYFIQGVANEHVGFYKFHDGTDENVTGYKLWMDWLGQKAESLNAIQSDLPETIAFWEEQLKMFPTVSSDSERLANIEKALEKSLILQKEVLTQEEVVIYTGYSSSYLYKLTSSNSIPHYKPLGNKLYFKRAELDEWMLSNRNKTVEEIKEEASSFLKKKKNRF